MPNYDLRCDACARIQTDVIEPLNAPRPLCNADAGEVGGIHMQCLGRMQRVWLPGCPASVIGDETDVWIKHGLCHEDGSPQHFTSKAAIAKEAERRGMTNYVVHQPLRSSDKNPNTVRWDTMSPVKEEDRLKRWYEHEASLTSARK
jgi:hypothetical protein